MAEILLGTDPTFLSEAEIKKWAEDLSKAVVGETFEYKDED